MAALAKAHERRFGVEIECGHPRGYPWVAQKMQDKGYRITNAYNQFDRYNIGSDGSGVEVRTPILQGMDGFREIQKVMRFLKRIGCMVTLADGMHVHHDCPEFVYDRPAVRRLVTSWVNNTHTIENMVAPSRRGRRTPWRGRVSDLNLLDDIVERRARRNHHYYDGEVILGDRPEDTLSCWGMFTRHDLNIAALREHGTVEFRLMEGSLDPADAIAWIRFGQRFLNAVATRKSAIPELDAASLFKRLQLGERQATRLQEKVRARRWATERNSYILTDARARVASTGRFSIVY